MSSAGRPSNAWGRREDGGADAQGIQRRRVLDGAHVSARQPDDEERRAQAPRLRTGVYRPRSDLSHPFPGWQLSDAVARPGPNLRGAREILGEGCRLVTHNAGGILRRQTGVARDEFYADRIWETVERPTGAATARQAVA